jgi:hypothetical protein
LGPFSSFHAAECPSIPWLGAVMTQRPARLTSPAKGQRDRAFWTGCTRCWLESAALTPSQRDGPHPMDSPRAAAGLVLAEGQDGKDCLREPVEAGCIR